VSLPSGFIFIFPPHFPSPPSSSLRSLHTPLSLSPQSFASAHHQPLSAPSATIGDLTRRTPPADRTDNAHHPKTGQPNATHGTRSLPPPPSTDADHHPVPPLTKTVPAPTIRCFSPQTLLFLSHLLHNPHLPSPPTTGTERISDNHPPRHQLGQPPPSIFPKIFPLRDSLGDTH
jgi:hypothetical protein